MNNSQVQTEALAGTHLPTSHRAVLGRQIEVLEITNLTFAVWHQTPGDIIVLIVHRNLTRIARAVADTVEWSRATVFQTVSMAVVANPVVVGVLGDRTLRHTVRPVLYVLTA